LGIGAASSIERLTFTLAAGCQQWNFISIIDFVHSLLAASCPGGLVLFGEIPSPGAVFGSATIATGTLLLAAAIGKPTPAMTSDVSGESGTMARRP
jgi:hypothetical protein